MPADWIGAHTGHSRRSARVPNLLVPDDTKVAVIKCLALRAGSQPHLCGDGSALRDGDPAGPAASSREKARV